MRRTVAVLGVAGYAAAVVALWRHHGIPLYGDRVIVWVLGLMLALSVTNLRRFARGFLLEWLPFVLALTAYDLLRGVADGRGLPAHAKPEIWIDRHVFGLGRVPTVVLQQHLWNAAHLRWYDYASWFVYLSHFWVTPLVALALWLWAHDRFRLYAVRVVALSFAAMVTYVVYPAVPPWLASDDGLLPPLTRTIGVVSGKVQILDGYAVYEKGTEWSNNVAAMPSLHEGLALLVSITLWPLAQGRWRPVRVLLVLYPIAMGFALVYTAEHYVIEVVVGLVYAVVVCRLVDLAGARWASRLGRKPSDETGPAPRPEIGTA